jgi:predicted DNA binding CopG/RHH family protein
LVTKATRRTHPPALPVAHTVPDFATDEEAAEWYETHDLSELPLEEVPLAPRGKLVTVAVRLSEREVEELKRRAGKLGVGYTTYLRMLVNLQLAAPAGPAGPEFTR